MTNRHIEAVTQMCPTCKAADEDLGDLIKIDDRLSLGGAARNRVRSKYMCWIHIIQAAGLKVKDSTKAIKPVVNISAWGQSRTTNSARSVEKSYTMVWDQAYSFQADLDDDELLHSTITLTVKDGDAWFGGTLGAITFESKTVNDVPNSHEFYKLWHNITLANAKGGLTTAGRLQMSICILSAEQMEANPELPLHTYDLDLDMWQNDNNDSKSFSIEADDDPQALQKWIKEKYDQNSSIEQSLSVWDVITITCWRVEGLPRVDSGRDITGKENWADPFLKLSYPGLGFTGRQKWLTSPHHNQVAAADTKWNFRLPIMANLPVTHNLIDLQVMDKNIGADVLLGNTRFYVSDILKGSDSKEPFWRSLYLDQDGCPPFYRGRILISISIQRGVNDVSRLQFSEAVVGKAAPTLPCSSYRLEVDLHEASGLTMADSEYCFDVAWGHPMIGVSEYKQRAATGFYWQSCLSNGKDFKYDEGKDRSFWSPTDVREMHKDYVYVCKRKDFIVHGLPDLAHDLKTQDEKAKALEEATRKSHQGLNDSAAVPFSTNTVATDAKSCMPDIIVYVSGKKGVFKECFGYLRIPVNGMKRFTENWEHGEDLTLFDSLWTGVDAKSDARCFPLKPLKELHDKVAGFLALRIKITQLTKAQASTPLPGATSSTWTDIPRTPRQKFRWTSIVYQARDLASVDDSGLSNPMVKLNLGSKDITTGHKPKTCFPTWFEAYERQDMYLPSDLNLAPDVVAVVYHKPDSVMGSFFSSTHFMGSARIACRDMGDRTNRKRRWYPLEFEEHQFGSILLENWLERETEPRAPAIDRKFPVTTELAVWPRYQLKVRSLALRGLLEKKIGKQRDTCYQFECLSQQTNIALESECKKKVVIPAPTDPIFFIGVQLRVFSIGKKATKAEREDKSNYRLEAVTSVSIQDLMQSEADWMRLLDLVVNTKERTRELALKKLKAAFRTKNGPARDYNSRLKHNYEYANSYQAPEEDGANPTADGPGVPLLSLSRESSSSPRESKASKDVVLEIDAEREKLADERANRPRAVGPDGNEEVPPKVLKSIDFPPMEEGDYQMTEEEQMRQSQWTLKSEYERLPFVPSPFRTFGLVVGKDEIHYTFMDKLFGAGKKNMGHVRGAFTLVKAPAAGEKEEEDDSKTDLISKEYKNPHPGYTIRVYIMHGLQLLTKGGSARFCDSRVVVTCGGQQPFKSPVKLGSVNPEFYCKAEFKGVHLPDPQSILTIEVLNEAGIFGASSIGSTTILLENRAFSKYWRRKKMKPVERRALRQDKNSLAQGHIEVCVDIVPDSQTSEEPMAYLLVPPVKTTWELRCIVWSTKDVTAKNVYQDEDSCCCVKYCAPPNQSDIQLRMGLPKVALGKTDTHLRAIEGEGLFNWRTVHDVQLPCAEPLAQFKVQVWNINWSPDDCIAEAVIPLWKFFEKARRMTRGKLDRPDYPPAAQIFKIAKQEVHLTHPFTTDEGKVMMEFELLPKKLAEKREFRAAEGPKAWELSEQNAEAYVLPKCVRPDSSFPWYRLDKQIAWRCKYFCKKTWGWWVLGLLLAIVAVCVYVWYYMEILSAVTD